MDGEEVPILGVCLTASTAEEGTHEAPQGLQEREEE
jgi:hypothetical protein